MIRNPLISRMPINFCVTPNSVVRVEHPLNPLSNELLAEMVDACRCNSDEVCGLITNQNDVLYVPNSHVEPRYNFYMENEDMREALHEIVQVQQSVVLGVFHTHHTNIPWPSPVDINGWPNPQLRWRYWIATQHEVIEWRLTR